MKMPALLQKMVARTAMLMNLTTPVAPAAVAATGPALGALSSSGVVDSFARALPGPGALLGLQATTAAGSQAALAASRWLSLQHHMVMGIIRNIGC